MGTMSVVIHRIIVVSDKVPSIDIIDISVSVIVDSVFRDFALVDPDVLFQIDMVIVNTGIDDSDDDAGVSSGDMSVLLHPFPCLVNADLSLIVGNLRW